MRRKSPIGALLFVQLFAFHNLSAQTPEPRTESSSTEIAQLRRMVIEQERRIATLERTVRTLQTTMLAANRRVVAPAWNSVDGWAAIRIGMSRTQVEDILGEPRTVDAVMDRQTLTYKAANTTDITGKVIIVDDRVAEVDSPRFQVHLPLEK
ncbi:MAG: outer membrane protein assembly factor BamE [Bryobacteraceae bacterium]